MLKKICKKIFLGVNYRLTATAPIGLVVSLYIALDVRRKTSLYYLNKLCTNVVDCRRRVVVVRKRIGIVFEIGEKGSGEYRYKLCLK